MHVNPHDKEFFVQDTAKTEQQLADQLQECRKRITQLEQERIELNQAQEALQQKEKDLSERKTRYQALFNTMVHGVVYQDTDGRIVDANPAAERLLGLTLAQMQGLKSMDAHWNTIRDDGSTFPGEEHPSRIALRTGCEVRDVVMGIYHPERECYRWINIQAVPQFLPGQTTPYQVYSTFEDITESERLENALQESNESLRALIASSPLAIIALDPEGIVTQWNPAAERIFGWQESEAIGRFLPIVPEENRTEHRILREQVLRGEGFENAEIRRLRKDGSSLDISVSTAPLRNRQGEVIGIMSVSLDITERKRADKQLQEYRVNLENRVRERTADLSAANALLMQEIAEREQAETALRNNEEKYQRLFENDLFAIGIFDQDTLQFLDVNDTVINLYGYTREELLAGMVATDLSADHTATVNSIQQARTTGTVHVELRNHQKKDGTVFPVETVGGSYVYKGRRVIFAIVKDISERLKLEEQLRLSEEKYRSLVESISDCIWEIDSAGRFTYLSPMFEEIFGYDPTAFLGQSPERLLPDDVAPQIIENVRGTFSERQPFTLASLPNRHKDGRKLVVDVRGFSFFSSDGEYKGRRGITRDVTAQSQAEDAVRLHLAVMETVEEGIFLVGLDDHIIKWTNSKFEQLFGYAPGEMIGMHVDRVNAPTDKSPTETRVSVVDLLLESGEWQGEIKNIRKDGTGFWCYAHVSLFDHPEFGSVMVSAHTDISDRVRIREALRKSEERVSLALEGAELGLWDWDIETGAVVFNERWAGMLGYTVAEIEPHVRSWEKLVHPEDMLSVKETLSAHLEGRTPYYESEHRLLAKSGDWIWILDKGKVTDRDEQGRPRRVAGTHLDLSERKRAEKERQYIEKAVSLGRMAGAIAHNFNNMLGAVMGNLELALDDIPEDSEQRRFIAKAMEASERAATISKLMLAYVGQSVGAVEPINVSKVVREACALFISSIPANVHLKTELAFSCPAIKGNSAQFVQIVNNLITNAVEAIGEKEGEITLNATTMTKSEIMETRILPLGWQPTAAVYVRLSITDTGCGVTADNQDKIFDPFFTTKFSGRGLGLSVVPGLLQGFGGAISVESQPERGATFKLFFPVFEQGAPVSQGTEIMVEGAAAGKRGLLVLVVDDEPVVRNMAEAMLTRKMGYQVITADNGFEAIEIFKKRQEEIGLVLLDLSMPGMNGWEVLAALRTVRSDIPVILTSGYDESQVMTGAYKERPQMFLQKPYQRNTLQEAIKAALRGQLGITNKID